MMGKVSLRFTPNQRAYSYLRFGFWSEIFVSKIRISDSEVRKKMKYYFFVLGLFCGMVRAEVVYNQVQG